MEHCQLDRVNRYYRGATAGRLVYTAPTIQGLEKVLVSACTACLPGAVPNDCCGHSTQSDVIGRWIWGSTTCRTYVASRLDVQTIACIATVSFSLWPGCPAVI